MRILVVEDEKKIADFILKGLKEEGYNVETTHDGEMGYYLATTEKFDIIVLDIRLPKMDGLTLCEKIKKEKDAPPILILSAKDTVEDKVKGLDKGADDYLTKPFAFEEFLARIRALLRKRNVTETTCLKIDDLVMDLVTHTVFRNNLEIKLTAKEFSFLEYMMRNAGRVLTRTNITQHVWGINFDTATNTIDVFINYLRKKVDHLCKKRLIHTVRGKGYILKE